MTNTEMLETIQSLTVLMAFVEAEPGNQFDSPGVLRRMFGFVSPNSI